MSGDTRAFRRQLSLFLPEPERAAFDALRQRFDPFQFSLIPAHVTLARDDEVHDLTALLARLRTISELSLRLVFADAELTEWGTIYVPVDDGRERFDALRQSMIGPNSRLHEPHVTIVHPRNVTGTREMLTEIRRATLPPSVTLGEIVLIEQVGSAPWAVVGRFPDPAAPGSDYIPE